VRRFGVLCFAALAVAVTAGCAAENRAEPKAAAASPPSCPKAWRAGWQRLANRIGAPVYCPGWLPDPLTGQIGGRWNNIDSVGGDRSYLESFVWQEMGTEIHVNLRGYPGTTRIPTCTETNTVAGKTTRPRIPCFADPSGRKRARGIEATVYTVNQDADQWHVLYAWRHEGSLYALSEHVAPPLSYRKVVQNLDRMLRTLVLVRPASTSS
jgi:hypothetical protein